MKQAPDSVQTRRDLTVDTIYVCEATSEAFVTPDGVGLVFYDTEDEAFISTGADAEDARLLDADTFADIASE
jgi:hypothetical protein